MPLVWDDVRELGRAGLILTLVVLFAVEYRAIDKEHKTYADDQKTARAEEKASFTELLDKQHAGVQSILDQQDKNMRGMLEQEQEHFERTLGSLVAAHQQEEREFANLLRQEHELFNQQSNMLDFLTGKLIPASDPTPKTNPACGFAPNSTLVFVGDSAFSASEFPHTILEINGESIIGIDRSPSGALELLINVMAADGRVIVRLDQRGAFIPSNRLFILKPDASTLIVQNEFGQDLINARYLNPHAFRINATKLPVRGKQYDIPVFGGDSCMNIGSKVDITLSD
jgi:hypothetical protein